MKEPARASLSDARLSASAVPYRPAPAASPTPTPTPPPPPPAAEPGRLGPVRGFHWKATATHVDMSTPLAPPRPLTLPTAPQTVTLDLARTALVIVDMQNDFCAAGGWVDHLGVDYTPDRAPIAPLQRLLPALRAAPACRSCG